MQVYKIYLLCLTKSRIHRTGIAPLQVEVLVSCLGQRGGTFRRGSRVTETAFVRTRSVVVLCALLFFCAGSTRPQQVAVNVSSRSAAPAPSPQPTSDDPPVTTQQGTASTFDAAVDQDSQPASEQAQATADDSDSGIPSMLPHFKNDRIWLSGQANLISQWHPAFHSPYAGKNSLSSEAQDATSRVLTLFTGLRLTSTSELLCDIQETGGNGLGQALGVAGFMNLDVVRNPTLSKAPYIARLMWHQIIPLSHKIGPSDRNPFSLFSLLPERRIEIRFGKLSMADFFDLNSYGTDSNFQFMNWTADNNGAYDYAADTRGFTFAAMAEYHHNRHVIVRFAEGLMPKVANGINLDADVGRAHAENLELELRGKLARGQDGVLRLLTFVNHANMGDYRTAIDNFL